MNNIQKNIESILKHINRQNVILLAVSKKQSPEAILNAYHAGITHFGENYLQEAIPKIIELKDSPFTWHFIGRIQSNKCKKIAELFNWVHTIDRLETAKKLNQANAALEKTQNICIQVNLFHEAQKSGINPDDIIPLIQEIKKLPQLKLRGLMTILPDSFTKEEQLKAYQQLHDLKNKLNQNLQLSMDTLSMGMSNDYVEAIAAGSTIIRLGQAIFGPR